MFFVKSLCVFCIAVLIGVFICTAEKKTFYYYTDMEKQKIEITRGEYFTIRNSEKNMEGKDTLNLSKEDVYKYRNGVIYGVTSFAFLMALIFVFEVWKRKNNAA